jgi:hypothetical protein
MSGDVAEFTQPRNATLSRFATARGWDMDRAMTTRFHILPIRRRRIRA